MSMREDTPFQEWLKYPTWSTAGYISAHLSHFCYLPQLSASFHMCSHRIAHSWTGRINLEIVVSPVAMETEYMFLILSPSTASNVGHSRAEEVQSHHTKLLSWCRCHCPSVRYWSSTIVQKPIRMAVGSGEIWWQQCHSNIAGNSVWW